MAEKHVTLVAFAGDEEFRRDPVEARAGARIVCGAVVEDVVRLDDAVADRHFRDEVGQDGVRARHRDRCVALDRVELGPLCVHVGEELGQARRVDDEVDPSVRDFRVEREACEHDEVQVFDGDTDLGPVLGRVERLRQHRGQGVVRTEKVEGVGGKRLESVRRGRVAEELDVEAAGSLVSHLVAGLAFDCRAEQRESSEQDGCPACQSSLSLRKAYFGLRGLFPICR